MMLVNGSYQVWTQARVDELIERWAGGDSAKIIGHAMAMSRNAILGKAFRLGLATRKSKIPFEAKPQRRVFVPRSLRPPTAIPDREVRRTFVTMSSPITGGFLATIRKLPRAPELTKNELRAQLTLAVLNTK